MMPRKKKSQLPAELVEIAKKTGFSDEQIATFNDNAESLRYAIQQVSAKAAAELIQPQMVKPPSPEKEPKTVPAKAILLKTMNTAKVTYWQPRASLLRDIYLREQNMDQVELQIAQFLRQKGIKDVVSITIKKYMQPDRYGKCKIEIEIEYQEA